MANKKQTVYRFYTKGTPDLNYVEIPWEECNSEHDWRQLWSRMNQWMERSNRQRYGREISDLTCPQHEQWLTENQKTQAKPRRILLGSSQ